MQHAIPLLFELGLGQDRFPGLLHDVVAGTILVTDHQPQHFDGCSSAEQGKNQRLDDTERPSNRARVSPRLEVMRAGNVPCRLGGCFVDRVPECDRVGDLRHGGGEVEIGGGIEHRVAPQDNERPDRAPLHRRDERGQRAHTRERRVLRLVVGDCAAVVAEIGIQCANRGVNGRGLTLPGHDQPLAAVRQKILGKGVDPTRVDTRDAGTCQACTTGRRRNNARSEGREEWRDLPALETEPMIRHGSRQRVDPLNRVESIHRATRGSRTPSGREAARVTDHLGVGQERVGVKREDDGRLIDPKHQVEVASRDGPKPREPVLVADRLVGRPGRPRKAGAELGCQARQRGGGEGLGEDRKSGTTIRGMSLG